MVVILGELPVFNDHYPAANATEPTFGRAASPCVRVCAARALVT
jgi:hypothetical protein